MSEVLNLEYLRKQAKSLLRKCRNADPGAIGRVRSGLPRLAAVPVAQIAEQIQLADIHQLLAREKGHANWAALKRHDAPLERFLAAIRGGALNTAKAELRNNPAILEESIHAACAVGHAEAVRQLLEADPGLVEAEMDGWKPLVYGCASPFHQVSQRHAAGIVECLGLLLDRGADPSTPSARHRARRAGNRSASLVLYQRGANPASVTPAQESSFEQAFWGTSEDSSGLDKALADIFQDTELVAEMNRRMKEAASRSAMWIRKDPASLSPKDVYAPTYPSNQDYNVMLWELLIKRGVQPNWEDTTQDSPLHHLAMWKGDAAAAEFFLANGAGVNLRRADGKTPYFLAVRFGNKAVADVLRAHGARQDEVRATDELIGACRRVDVQAAAFIIRRYPDVLKQLDASDKEVLIEAAGQNRLDVVKLMLEIGFDPSGIGDSGATPLHAAAWHGHTEMVRLLLTAGASTQARDTVFESSPRDWALHGSKHCRDAAEDYALIMTLLEL